jgi:hypothetical protein
MPARSLWSRVAACVAALTLGTTAGTTAARAQAAPPPAGALPYDQTLSVGILTIPLGVASAEYERKLGGPLTLGLTGTYATTSQLYPRRDRFAAARLMYYPGGRPLEGLAVGVTAGAHRAERKYGEDPATVLAHDGGATLGAIVTYNGYYGPGRRFFFGPGVGVKRVLKSVAANSPLASTYFEGRAAFGVAF